MKKYLLKLIDNDFKNTQSHYDFMKDYLARASSDNIDYANRQITSMAKKMETIKKYRERVIKLK